MISFFFFVQRYPDLAIGGVICYQFFSNVGDPHILFVIFKGFYCNVGDPSLAASCICMIFYFDFVCQCWSLNLAILMQDMKYKLQYLTVSLFQF